MPVLRAHKPILQYNKPVYAVYGQFRPITVKRDNTIPKDCMQITMQLGRLTPLVYMYLGRHTFDNLLVKLQ